MRRIVAATVIVVLGTGAARAQPPMPYGPVPPPRYEPVPPPPGAGMVWEPGHWHWDGVRYVWIGGHYVGRRMGYGHWIPGHWRWAPYRGHWIWIPSHWG